MPVVAILFLVSHLAFAEEKSHIRPFEQYKDSRCHKDIEVGIQNTHVYGTGARDIYRISENAREQSYFLNDQSCFVAVSRAPANEVSTPTTVVTGVRSRVDKSKMNTVPTYTVRVEGYTPRKGPGVDYRAVDLVDLTECVLNPNMGGPEVLKKQCITVSDYVCDTLKPMLDHVEKEYQKLYEANYYHQRDYRVKHPREQKVRESLPRDVPDMDDPNFKKLANAFKVINNNEIYSSVHSSNVEKAIAAFQKGSGGGGWRAFAVDLAETVSSAFGQKGKVAGAEMKFDNPKWDTDAKIYRALQIRKLCLEFADLKMRPPVSGMLEGPLSDKQAIKEQEAREMRKQQRLELPERPVPVRTRKAN